MPKVGFGSDQQTKEDLFEESLEDALCVFKTSGANTDLLAENENQVLFYVDLDNEAIVSKEEKESQDGDQDGDLELD